MAKVKAPLLSFEASGKLADAIVYFPWKGIDAVRQYVIPANPQSSAQTTQRGYLTNAVNDWHDTSKYDAADKEAWNRYAGIAPSPRSGFNSFVKSFIDISVAGQTPDMGYNGSLADDGDGTFTGQITEAGSADAVDMIWGTSKTALVNTTAASEAVNTWSASPADVVSGQKVYARFRIKSGGNLIGETGIFELAVA
jgi:hypothetical protein